MQTQQIKVYSNALLQVIKKSNSTHNVFYVTALTNYACTCCNTYKLINCKQTQKQLVSFMRKHYNVKNVLNINVLQRNTLALTAQK